MYEVVKTAFEIMDLELLETAGDLVSHGVYRAGTRLISISEMVNNGCSTYIDLVHNTIYIH